jgi:protein O-GlcNAcase/histone acetyltransferase
MLASAHIRGYIEGYYGRILSWPDRRRMLTRLADCGMNTYLWAPKEDMAHRLAWRTPWDDEWCAAFKDFCELARISGITVLAGIAPGIDFDFHNENSEFEILLQKSNKLIDMGADAIVLMFDDIEPGPDQFYGDNRTEAEAHAAIAKRLSDGISAPVMLVPRVYADEIVEDDEVALQYYHDLAAGLPPDMPVFHCGRHIVAGTNPLQHSYAKAAGFGRLIIWDNVYCNDYCPRRLFVGPHKDRGNCDDLMLNGTGLPETDLLLISLMAAGDNDGAWRAALANAGVPDAFLRLSSWFNAPVTTNSPPPSLPDLGVDEFAALEILLWRWKSPLAMEWYPFLFGLKHDALIAGGEMPDERLAKTQTSPLHKHLRQN